MNDTDNPLRLAEWIWKISDEDRGRVVNALSFGSNPGDFGVLMEDLRSRYDFIPGLPNE